MTDPHPAALTPEQRAADLLRHYLPVGEMPVVVRYAFRDAVAASIRSAVMAEREAIAGIFDRRAEGALEKAERLAKDTPGVSEELRRCAAELRVEASAIRARSTETDHDR